MPLFRFKIFRSPDLLWNLHVIYIPPYGPITPGRQRLVHYFSSSIHQMVLDYARHFLNRNRATLSKRAI